MATPNMPPHNSRSALPKDNNARRAVTSPPPAYSPQRHIDLATLAARTIHARQGNPNMAQVHHGGQALYTTILDSAGDEQEDPADSSPISLRINTSINVNRSNNIVCLSSSPAEHANAIAQAVVKALNEGSAGQCGIPMIDENGVPRPLRIEVDAGMVVDGTNNVVGNRELVTMVLQQRGGGVRRPREDDHEDEDDEEMQPAAKRRRSSQ